ncbi:MAG: hypothetical protein Q7R39_02050, partial [Dehalococcoidia bacterium]|nr:hypothetical protein [Dehalococcoidia bacterium]
APEVAAPSAPLEAIEEEAVGVAPDHAILRQQVFSYLADHPDGVRMTDLEREFGVIRLQMVRLLKGLIDENTVKKEDLLYFAI